MKFAVIEYTTKNGRIWRHSQHHPNYLGDPLKEIDPTSFACYTSALQGEHIPLTGLITGEISNTARWRAPSRKIFKKISGRWPQIYSLSYLKEFNCVLVVHQISNGFEVTAFVKRLKQLYPAICVIGVPTQPYGILEEHWQQHPADKADTIAFAQACDVFVTVVKSTLPDWEKISGRGVTYLPQPYPVEYAQQYFVPSQQKLPILFVAGNTERSDIRKGQLVAKRLQHSFPNHSIKTVKIPGIPLDTTNLEGARYEIIPFEQWREHLPTLGKVKLVINTDYTLTRGRVQVDSAAVGTPSLGANSDGQADLFPALKSSQSTSVDTLVAAATRLLTDQHYYDDIVNYARQKLAAYNYSTSAKRIERLYQDYVKTLPH